MTAIIFALLSFIGWGSGDIFGVIATRRIGAFKTSFWVWALSLVYLTAMAPFFIPQLKGMTPSIFLLLVVLGIIVMASYVSFTEALRIGNASIVGTICGSFVGLVVLLSVIFLHETLTAAQVLAIIVIVIGLGLTSLNFEVFTTRAKRPSRAIVLSFLTVIGWAIYFTFLKIPIQRVGWFWPDYIATAAGTIFLLCFGPAKAKLSRNQIRRGLVPSLWSALISGGGAITYNVALSYGSTAVVAPIAGAYPVLFVIISSVLFKDKTLVSQRIGMGVTLIGIVTLAKLSS